MVSGPREGRERQVYPVGRFKPSMLRTLVVHGTRLVIGGSLESPVSVFCPKEYGEAHLPTFPFMVVDMRRVLCFRSTPRRVRRPLERCVDRFVEGAPRGKRGKSRGPQKTPRRAKRRRNDSGGEGGRAMSGATEEVAAGLEEDDEVQILGVCSPRRTHLDQSPPPGSS